MKCPAYIAVSANIKEILLLSDYNFLIGSPPFVHLGNTALPGSLNYVQGFLQASQKKSIFAPVFFNAKTKKIALCL